MSAPARLAGLAALLAAVFAAATLAGAALDPRVHPNTEGHGDDEEMGAPGLAEAETHATGGELAPGLAVAQDGYRLVPEQTTLARGSATNFTFRIVDERGGTVREFDLEHERFMHLIVIRRDFADFQHLHPNQLADGSWEVGVDTSDGGVYRAFADFAAAGQSLTLASDLFVAGRFNPRPLPVVAATADAGMGYEVSLDSATPESGGASPARFTISRNGREVDEVEPYLGADGHLVALREHDQAFLHTHPEGEPGGPAPVSFQVEYPGPGRYRLFLQFKHAGEVRTAAFTQEVSGFPAAEAGHDVD